MSANKKIYAAADFGRYHRGEMSAAEMHAVERAALHDPFVADALEGYSFTEKPEEDIADLEQRLAMVHTPVINITRNINLWWKIAAVVILMGGLGYFGYQFSTNEKELRIAENTVKDPEESMITQDSVKDILEDQNSPEGNETERIAQTRLESARKSASQAASQAKSREDVSAAVSVKMRSEAEQKSAKKTAPENMPYTLQGKVVNAEGMSLADASVSNTEDRLVTKTDNEGNYTLKATETEVQSEIQVIGYGTVKQKLEANLSNVVVVNADKNVINNNASMPNNAAKSSSQPVKMKKTINQAATPIGGMTLYKNYLKNNITKETDENGLQYIGIVKLRFDLDADGHPQNIKVIQSLCPACDKQAISLLKNGVPWTGATGKPYEIEVEF